MRRALQVARIQVLCVAGLLLVLGGTAGALRAQDPGEKSVTICDATDPANKCPGADCVCLPDTIEITFDGATDSVYEYDTFTVGQAIDTTVVIDTKTPVTQGWAYGVRHDPEALLLTSSTTDGTDARVLMDSGFDATSKDDIQTCGDPTCTKANRIDGGGWISAMILSFTKPVELPIKRNTVAKASYQLQKDVGPGGTLIEFTDQVAKKQSPPVDLSFTANGKSRAWTTGVSGWIKAGSSQPIDPSQLLCDAEDPVNRCPGADCVCVADTLEVTFDGDRQTRFEYADFVQGLSIDVTVMTETKNQKVLGWSYGVRHDMSALTVVDASITGTVTEQVQDVGFNATSHVDIETCDSVPACRNRTAGGGWISAIVLSFTKPVELPLARNSIARARYTLDRDVGASGTLIEFTDRLAKKKSPPTDLSLVIDGRNRRWTLGTAGLIQKAGGEVPFVRGDVGIGSSGDPHPADGVHNITDSVRILRKLFAGEALDFDCEKAADTDDNGIVNISDSIGLLNYLFLGESPPAAPFPDPGADPTADDLGCTGYP